MRTIFVAQEHDCTSYGGIERESAINYVNQAESIQLTLSDGQKFEAKVIAKEGFDDWSLVTFCMHCLCKA